MERTSDRAEQRAAASIGSRWAAALPAIAGAASVLLAARMLLERHRFPGKLSFFGHCVAPALVGVALWAAILLRPALRGRLSALVLSVLIALFGAEIVIRNAVPAEHPDIAERSRRALAAGIRFDKRTQFEKANDLRREGERAFPMHASGTVMEQAEGGRWRSAIAIDGREVLPLGGVARARTMLGNETGVQPDFTSDELGFNNPPGLWDKAPIDVLLTGDSFTLGWGVAPEKNFAAPIRARFARTVNLGVTGAGPLAELGQLREFGPVLKPKVTVLFFYEGNDLRDLNREKASQLAQYLDPAFSQGLHERRAEVDRALAAYGDAQLARIDGLLFRAVQVLALKRVRALAGFASPPLDGTGPADWPLFKRAIHEIKAAPAAWGGKLLFVFLPKWSRFARTEDPRVLERDRERVLAVVKAEGIPVLDVVDVFQASGDPLDAFPYRLHGHYSERGYRLVGDAVVSRLAEGDLAITPP
ncbi:MAG: GDSL-type esterase/lipase family protein [Minicystis sp.]